MTPLHGAMRSRRFFKSFEYAFQGIKLLASERNFRIQMVFGALAIICTFLLGLTSTDTAIIILCVALVLGGEAVNSSAERLLNFVSAEHREEIREIKDGMAAAVLIFSAAAFVIGIWIFGNALLLR
jgi:diacylglycerol kinase